MALYAGEFRRIQKIDVSDGMGHPFGLENQPATKGEVNAKLNQLAQLYDEWANYFMENLDHMNVRRLFTEHCKIQSKDGETEIQGPLLIMKDKQGTPVVRLKMGYDKDSEEFVHQLMNASGDITVSLDSSGNLVVERGTFKGSITIGSGNDVFKAGPDGIWLGHADYALAPFKVSKSGAATATNLTIIGGVIKTAATGARIEMSGNKLETYNSSNELEGPAIDPVDGLMWFFKNGIPILTFGYGGTDLISMQALSGYKIEIDGHATEDWVLENFAPETSTEFGVFGVTPTVQQTAALLGSKVTTQTAGAAYTANEQAMLNNLKTDMQSVFAKIDGILNKLALYGLFDVTCSLCMSGFVLGTRR